MKTFRSYKSLKLVRDTMAFFDLEFGIGRGPVTGSEKSESMGRAQQQVTRYKEQLAQMQEQLSQVQQRASRQRQQLEKRKEQIAARENRIKALQDQAVQMRVGAAGGSELRLGNPESRSKTAETGRGSV